MVKQRVSHPNSVVDLKLVPFCINSYSSLHFYVTNNHSSPEVQLGWLASWEREYLFIAPLMLVKIRRRHCKKGP